MMKLFAPAALATVMMVVGASYADAYTRSAKSTGPGGRSISSQGAGSCSGGRCASNQSVTGPRGASATRAGNTSCSGGSCSGGATYTGPRGQSGTRTRSLSR